MIEKMNEFGQSYKGLLFWNPTEFDIYENSENISDKILRAYEAGKERGKAEYIELYEQRLLTNIDTAGQVTSSLLLFMKEKGIEPKSAHLKINDFDDLVVLIRFGEKEYISKSFLEVYSKSSELEEKSSEDPFFGMSFMFASQKDDSFNKDELLGDNFYLKFNFERIEPETSLET